jgi:hypothetical protein
MRIQEPSEPPLPAGFSSLQVRENMPRIGICCERQRLLDAYGKASSDLFQSGRALAAAAASYEADVFQRLWDRCETARGRCADIRHQLTTHMHEHGCELGLFSTAASED